MGFKISLAGDLGSGKSTVSRLLMARTGAEYYSTGMICRAEAAKHSMTIDEFNRYMETHPEVDKAIDDALAALTYDPRTLVIDSRMAFHFVKGTFRVYMATAPHVSAARILADKRAGESFDTVEETARRVAARRKSESLRYFEKYGVHITDMQNYDLVLDTTAITPEEVADIILASLDAWQKDPAARFCYLDYCRFAVKAQEEGGDPASLPRVRVKDGIYYVLGGAAAIRACKERGERIVPCILLPGEPESTEQYAPLF